MLQRNTSAAPDAPMTPASTQPMNRFQILLRASVAAIALLGLMTHAVLVHAATSRMIAPGVYVIPGDAGDITPANLGRIANAAFVVGPRGVVVVESGVSFRHGEAIIAAVEAVTRRPIRLVIVTHAAQDVLFGAAAFQARGIPVLMHRDAAALMAARCDTCLRTLNATLGAQPMVGSRVVTPDRTVTQTTTVDVIGRPLRLIAPASASSPGALAVYDAMTRTLIAGDLATIDRIPDMRDADGKPWREGLALARGNPLPASHSGARQARLVRGPRRASTAISRRSTRACASSSRRGVGLADVAQRADLPHFAGWDRYASCTRRTPIAPTSPSSARRFAD